MEDRGLFMKLRFNEMHDALRALNDRRRPPVRNVAARS